MHAPDQEWWLAHSADYVLGVLGEQDRKVFERIMHFEPSVQAMVRDWRATLQPMADALPPVDAPDHILPALLSDLPVQVAKPVKLNYQTERRISDESVAAAAAGGAVVAGKAAHNAEDSDKPLKIEGSSVMKLIGEKQRAADRWRGFAGWITVACIGLAGWVYHLYH